MAKEIVAMILAGGRGSRLYALTQKTAKPAVGFGGKYRIVDFPLSNCVNSNIDTVGIATQYQPQKLNEYIGNGQPWDLDRLYGGVHTLPPYEQAKGTDWYKGTANAIYQNISFIDSYDPEYVIILSGDQICKQDYADFLRFHKEKGAEFSVAVMEVDWKEASRFGLMVADENGEDIVCADSMWTLMDMETKHPVRIEEEDAKGYEIRPRYPMERCGRKIRLPKEFEVVDTVVVPKADIDYNGHMSNAKYILLANEYLEDITRVSRIRVEYKSQARYRETLVIERAQLENKTDGGTETHVIVKMSGKEAGDVKAVVDYSIIEA